MTKIFHYCSPPLVPNPAVKNAISKRKIKAYIYIKDYCCIECEKENLERKKGQGVRLIHPSLHSIVADVKKKRKVVSSRK